VGDTLVIRVLVAPTAGEAAQLSEEFADIVHGSVQVLDGPLPAERSRSDFPELPRLALRFDRVSYARLRDLIDAINRLPSAPPAADFS
jgi:hypothetical protein